MVNNKRKTFSLNPYESKIFRVIFIFASLPVLVIILLFFGLFSDLIYSYIRSDHGARFMDLFMIFAFLLVLYYIILARMVYRFVNRLVGANERLIRELDQIIDGVRKTPLRLRKHDYGQELIDRINKLIEKLS